MSKVVRVERDGDVAVVVIDNPPINAGSSDVRAGILAAIQQAGADSQTRAVVIIGAGTTFIAGSDIREFGQPLADPQLPQVIAAIEACPKPVIAALHGAALGGGLELALGCDLRIAQSGTVLGLPEVTLGIIPGAGGTQRLPRLVGLPRAIGIIGTGERVPADAALALGIVDKVVPADLREEATAMAAAGETQKRVLRLLAVPVSSETDVSKASDAALRAGKNRPAVRAAIEAIVNSATLPFAEALAAERAAFQGLRTSREARALRHQFFAERDAAKQPGLEGVQPQPVKKVAVIGAGTMGSGIAITLLDAGYQALLFERDRDALDRGLDRIRSYYAGRVKAGKLPHSALSDRESRLEGCLEWAELSAADLVIEAVFEDLTVKQDVFRSLSAVMKPGVILASNTSYIDLDAIASATARPSDVVGLHFFSPAQVMKLVEVVRGKETSPTALVTALAVGKRLKKIPVVTGNAFGFIGNRIYTAYRRQCEFMLEEGATPQQVDNALEGFGFAMGPFAVADMSGLDIAWRMRQSQAATRDPSARYVTIPDQLCEAGRLGQKTGGGYYAYAPGGRPQPDEVTMAIIEEARAAKGVTARTLDPEEIVRRVLVTMANETALLLAEKVASRATDVDVVLVNGYGFPRWEGGPVFWARERGLGQLAEDLGWLATLSGPGFVRGDLRELLPQSATP